LNFYFSGIFEKFYKLGSEVLDEEKGTGLDLAIMKKIVEGYKGEIRAKSKEGMGTYFNITLIR